MLWKVRWLRLSSGIDASKLLLVVVLLAGSPSMVCSGEPPARINPIEGYSCQVVQGFEVYFSKKIDASQPAASKVAQESLRKAMVLAMRPLPQAVSDSLRSKVRLWIEYDNSMLFPGYNGHQIGGPAYIPMNKEVKVRNEHEQKRGSIEISARVCLLGAWGTRMANSSPYWLLHEFAHAHHEHNLEAMNQRIFNDYRAAMERKLYDAVDIRLVDENGKITTQKTSANARVNHYEYFAELSVAYLATNHYYPHTREDLKEHDLRGYKLMEEIWQIKKK
jgi:hypothetical protein